MNARHRLSKHALSCALHNAINAALNSGDYARMEAVHNIVEKEQSSGVDFETVSDYNRNFD